MLEISNFHRDMRQILITLPISRKKSGSRSVQEVIWGTEYNLSQIKDVKLRLVMQIFTLVNYRH